MIHQQLFNICEWSDQINRQICKTHSQDPWAPVHILTKGQLRRRKAAPTGSNWSLNRCRCLVSLEGDRTEPTAINLMLHTKQITSFACVCKHIKFNGVFLTPRITKLFGDISWIRKCNAGVSQWLTDWLGWNVFIMTSFKIKSTLRAVWWSLLLQTWCPRVSCYLCGCWHKNVVL